MRKLHFFRAALVASALVSLTFVDYAQAQRREGGQRPGGAPGQRQAAPELPKLELKGAEKFDAVSEKVTPGVYQVAYSAKNDALFVTSAVGRQVSVSALVKVDPATLKIVAKEEIKRVPDNDEGILNAVYGIGVDDANDTVWVTTTRTGSVAVYKQSDLSLVKQFGKDVVGHPRDVIIDSKQGKAYVSGQKPEIVVFDTKTLEPAGTIELKTTSTAENAAFMPMSLDLDSEKGKLFTVSMRTGEVAVIDTASGKVDKIFAVTNADRASGVAYDSANNRVLVANQGTGNLLIVDPVAGKVVHDVFVGAGALNVAFDPVSKLSFVSCRGAGTVAVVSSEGELVANLDGGSFPNHLKADGKGNVFSLNKARGEEDPTGDRLTRLKLK